MSTRHLLCAGITLTGLVAGCRPSTPQPAPQPAQMPSAQRTTGTAPGARISQAPDSVANIERPVIRDAHPTADALKLATEQYAKSLEALMAKQAPNGAPMTPRAGPGGAVPASALARGSTASPAASGAPTNPAGSSSAVVPPPNPSSQHTTPDAA
ncbi:MAG TPA: hypothetical protein VFC78_18380, partial [Tepidisphaeraceae bacterium]|nr:hypothetical protein [Tepidisphaeraceae bacterium]